MTDLGTEIPTSTVYPRTVSAACLSLRYITPMINFLLHKDGDGNPLSTEFGLSTYRDHQIATLQEMPERVPVGSLPRPLDILLDGDLANIVKPGDRVQVVGVYKTFGGRISAASSKFKVMLLACNVKHLARHHEKLSVSDADIREIKKISKNKNLINLLTASLAPSIFGHAYVKLAILLQLLGGVEKILANGAHLRGDINILLIGDPSTAKSQMLRYVISVAPLAVATTGRGSTGVGLTAAVVHDKETGERTLEAGAMVFGDRGVVCIDEFDKMSDIDRVAIHEAMEQQTVTIAKGGIHTTLNARCSVLAAANPAYGHYMIDKPPNQNILLPDSLLSRFDLVFVVLDTMDDESNRRISEHVLKMHRYVSQNDEGMGPHGNDSSNGYISVQQIGLPSCNEIYDKSNKLFYQNAMSEKLFQSPSKRSGGSASGRRMETVQLLTTSFLKKYIHYAKTRVKPVLTSEASEVISQGYAELRAVKEGVGDKSKTMPVTARTLETLIRLSTALAKARLSPKVEKSDADTALELLRYSLFREVKTRYKRKKLRASQSADQSGAGSSGDEADDPSSQNMPRDLEQQMRRPVVSRGPSSRGDTSDMDGVVVSMPDNANTSSSERVSLFRKLLYKARLVIETKDKAGSAKVDRIIELINSNPEASPHFSQQESLFILRSLSTQNIIWLQEGNSTVIFV